MTTQPKTSTPWPVGEDVCDAGVAKRTTGAGEEVGAWKSGDLR